MIKKMLGRIAVALALGAAAIAQATPVTWTLSNVKFDDGASLSGSFVWDASANSAGSFSFLSTAGSTLGGNGYDTGNAFFYNHGQFTVHDYVWLSNDSDQPYFSLVFTTDLTDAGGTISLASVGFYQGGFECGTWDCTASPVRFIVSGEATASTQSVPEPASLALVGLGLVGAGLARRKITAKVA